MVLVSKTTHSYDCFESFKNCNFRHLDSKNDDFFGFEGWKKVQPICFHARRPKKTPFLYNERVTAQNRRFWPRRFRRSPVARVGYFFKFFLLKQVLRHEDSQDLSSKAPFHTKKFPENSQKHKFSLSHGHFSPSLWTFDDVWHVCEHDFWPFHKCPHFLLLP